MCIHTIFLERNFLEDKKFYAITLKKKKNVITILVKKTDWLDVVQLQPLMLV